MTPTHILVPIDEYNRLAERDYDAANIMLRESPKVCLDEEYIKEKAYQEAKEMTFIKDKESFDFGYQQAIKDLLNTK
jgi:hypothetical protein